MRFEGEFKIPGQPAAVLAAFEDVERMVKCMPGASIDGRTPEGDYLGSMLVAFGPKKIKFKGKVKSAVDHAAGRGTLDVRGAAEMRTAAPAEVHVQYSVKQDPEASAPMTVVSLVSDAEIGGVMADFARTGGIAVTQALMTMFAERLAKEFSQGDSAPALTADADASASASASAATAAPAGSVPTASEPVEAFSAGSLFWLVVKAKLLGLRGWMRSKLRIARTHS